MKISDIELKNLNDRNFIFNGDKIELRDRGRLLFEEDNIKELFEEFFYAFPAKTPDSRRLRPSSPDTKIGNDAFIAYKRKVRKKNQHDELMVGLKNELNERESKDSMSYINNILTWIRNATWEMYDEDPDAEGFSETFLDVE